MVQLSFLSSVVPVFTDTALLAMLRKDEVPNAADLALLSKRMCEMIKAVSGLTARSPCMAKKFGLGRDFLTSLTKFGSLYLYNSSPFLFFTSKIAFNFLGIPRLGKAEKA